MSALFLDIDQVLRIHASMIEQYGGEPGVRDVGLLLSAVATPQATFEGTWLLKDVFEMASAYLFHIVQNHPFLDGKKRTGAASAIIFLALNGVTVAANEDGLVELTLAVASGKVRKLEVVEFFRQLAQS